MKTYCENCETELEEGLGLGEALAHFGINTWCPKCKIYPSNPIVKN